MVSLIFKAFPGRIKAKTLIIQVPVLGTGWQQENITDQARWVRMEAQGNFFQALETWAWLMWISCATTDLV